MNDFDHQPLGFSQLDMMNFFAHNFNESCFEATLRYTSTQLYLRLLLFLFFSALPSAVKFLV